jgi:hypothetical protein
VVGKTGKIIMMKVTDRGLELTTRKRGATKAVGGMCDAGSNAKRIILKMF